MRLSHYKYNLGTGLRRVRTRTALVLSSLVMAASGSGVLSFALLGSAHAATPAWNLNGSYTLSFEYQGGTYLHDATVTGQNGAGNFTVNGGYPAATTPKQTVWGGTGNISGTDVTMSVDYSVGAPNTHMNMAGVVASNGTLSGTWTDNYNGETRTGTWTTASGHASHFASQVIVTPTNTQGWSTADTRPGGAVNYVADVSAPGTPHAGALGLTTNATNEAKAQYLHATNTALSDVTELSYSTKQNAANFPGGDASYQLVTCLNGGTVGPGCNGFTTLVYEPYQGGQGAVTPGSWQSWDIAAGGLFWSSKPVTCSNGAIVGSAGGPATYTLAQIKAACPSAVVTGFGVNVGTYNPSYNVETDLVNFNNTVYNFEPQVGPTDKDQCRKDGYKNFTNPSFKNQGQCIRYVDARADGDMTMSNPNQRIKLAVSNQSTQANGNGSIEYWNFDYPGGLHYQAQVLCANINAETDEARFMWQIPAGHPGLSGMYVVAYVKEVKGAAPDLYGHSATSSVTEASQWCQTGAGFAPTMYPVNNKKTELEVD